DLSQVTTKGKLFKVAVFSLAGTIGISFLAAIAALLAELLDARLRTVNEATKTFGAPAFCSISPNGSAVKKADLGTKLWLRWRGERGKVGRVVWSPAADSGEEEFWRMLL